MRSGLKQVQMRIKGKLRLPEGMRSGLSEIHQVANIFPYLSYKRFRTRKTATLANRVCKARLHIACNLAIAALATFRALGTSIAVGPAPLPLASSAIGGASDPPELETLF